MRKLLIVLAVVVVVLGGILVVADRLLVAGAQDEIGRQVAVKYKLKSEPDVEIRGFPFLTQALAGNYDEIAVTVKDIRQGGMTLSQIDAVLYGVRAPLSDLLSNPENADVTADRIEGTMIIPMKAIERKFEGDVKLAMRDGKVVLVGDMLVVGRKLPVVAAVTMKAAKERIRIVPVDIKVANGEVAPTRAIRQRLTYDLPLPNLPLNLQVKEVTPSPKGVVVTATAEDVPLTGRS